MKFIKGKFTKIIYVSEDSNYIVALFHLSDSNDRKMEKYLGKTIHVTGIMPNPFMSATYILNGELTNHPKFSWQYSFTEYQKEKPSTIDAIREFLASPFVEGCGQATATKIVDLYKEDSLNVIKEDYRALLSIKGMNELKAIKIYHSILAYEKDDELILNLKQMGFSLEDASKILSKHYSDIDAISEGNLYLLKDIFDFDKIDNIYVNNYDPNSALRIEECLLCGMEKMSFSEGSTFYYIEDISKALLSFFKINLSIDEFEAVMTKLIERGSIIKYGKRFYLSKYYEAEEDIARDLKVISTASHKKYANLDEKIEEEEKRLDITYNEEQKKAIKSGLLDNIAIISGGPGTGKTTIIKAITSIYINENKLSKADIMTNIGLLAPTGRAAKKLSSSTGLPAYTIHRFLKWHKDNDSFEFCRENKLPHKLIIVDESSMIDVNLASSLISALKPNAKIVLVGDIYQLPSVGPGLILSDLINSDYFSYNPLSIIYRQSENSYIPYLAKDIKYQNIDEEFQYKKDDYNFIVSEEENILNRILEAAKYGLTKGINEDNMQVLAPMYKGLNGIDNLNKHLQEIYNPYTGDKEEIKYSDKTYRENDKVLQLINDAENNVFNGDIGKIVRIYKDKNKTKIQIDFDKNLVTFEKKDLKNITHAYAISIHKSQGSEFEHVLMPICKSYYIMLYNKLLYTGVSRAKKSLTIIGEPRAFISGIQNNYSSSRKTSLIDFLDNNFSE